MKTIALATSVLAVSSGLLGSTGAVAASPLSSHEANDTFGFAVAPGNASPGQVKDAMQRLGMSVLDTPVTSLLSGENRVAASESASIIECNGNYCVWVKPQVSSQKISASTAHEAEQLLGRVRQAGPTTLASLLTEMDHAVKPGEPWSVVRGANGAYFVG